MACPTCDHTMHGFGGHWFWCPGCGTTLNDNDREHTVSVPKVTDAARNFVLVRSITADHARQALGHMVLLPAERFRY